MQAERESIPQVVSLGFGDVLVGPVSVDPDLRQLYFDLRELGVGQFDVGGARWLLARMRSAARSAIMTVGA